MMRCFSTVDMQNVDLEAAENVGTLLFWVWLRTP